MAHYFPVFISAFMFALFALAVAGSSMGSTYMRGVPAYRSYTGLDVGIASIILSAGNFLILRGRAWGVWILAGSCVMSFFIVLFTYSYQPHPFIYTTGLLFPLLSLYLLNTHRHRQMRAELVLLRHERERYKAGFRPPAYSGDGPGSPRIQNGPQAQARKSPQMEGGPQPSRNKS